MVSAPEAPREKFRPNSQIQHSKRNFSRFHPQIKTPPAHLLPESHACTSTKLPLHPPIRTPPAHLLPESLPAPPRNYHSTPKSGLRPHISCRYPCLHLPQKQLPHLPKETNPQKLRLLHSRIGIPAPLLLTLFLPGAIIYVAKRLGMLHKKKGCIGFSRFRHTVAPHL